MKDLWLELNGTPCVVTVEDGCGEAVVKGRKWRWSFHRYCGPTFLRKDGEAMKRFPSERNPVWKAFAKWLKRWKKENE